MRLWFILVIASVTLASWSSATNGSTTMHGILSKYSLFPGIFSFESIERPASKLIETDNNIINNNNNNEASSTLEPTSKKEYPQQSVLQFSRFKFVPSSIEPRYQVERTVPHHQQVIFTSPIDHQTAQDDRWNFKPNFHNMDLVIME